MDIQKSLEAVMPRRKARAVANEMLYCGVIATCDLPGKHIPAHFATDLSVPARAVDKLGCLLHRNGATLVR